MDRQGSAYPKYFHLPRFQSPFGFSGVLSVLILCIRTIQSLVFLAVCIPVLYRCVKISIHRSDFYLHPIMHRDHPNMPLIGWYVTLFLALSVGQMTDDRIIAESPLRANILLLPSWRLPSSQNVGLVLSPADSMHSPRIHIFPCFRCPSTEAGDLGCICESARTRSL